MARSLPKKQTVISLAGWLAHIRIWTAIPPIPQGINYLNQLLGEINDCVQKSTWVVEGLMGSLIDTWLDLIGSKGLNISLPIPCKIMPPSLCCIA